MRNEFTTATDLATETGDESGSPPGDRRFRPDVQGLRAIAILLVALYHASIPGISGGYVGVDVFFVISGFVITGLLLRERESSQRTSLIKFLPRRARRIIPAGSLVIIVTVVAAFILLRIDNRARDGHRWTVGGPVPCQFSLCGLRDKLLSVAATAFGPAKLLVPGGGGTVLPYLSPYLHGRSKPLWPSLVAYPSCRCACGRNRCLLYVFGHIHLDERTECLLLTPDASLGARSGRAHRGSQCQPPTDTSAYGRPYLMGRARRHSGSESHLDFASPYPGALVAIPVLGAGLVIAGGAAQPEQGVELLLRQRPFQLLGVISYSLYLWHWPILVIATQYRGVVTLPILENILLLIVAALVSIATYRVLENPVRHAKFLIRRPWTSVGTGICLIALTLAVTTAERHRPAVDLGSLAAATPGSACDYATRRSSRIYDRRTAQLPPATDRSYR